MRRSIYRGAALLCLGVLASSLLAAVPAAAASDCPSGSTQFKIDSRPSDGTYGDGTLSVTISNADEDSFNWSSNIEVDSVMVKAGTSLKENPGGRSGTASSAMNPSNDKPYGISHVSFCYSTGGDDNQSQEEDCPEDGTGKGNMPEDCDEDTSKKNEDCPESGNGNMSKDCDEVESGNEVKRCPDGSRDENGDMAGGCGGGDGDDDKDDGDATQADVEKRQARPAGEKRDGQVDAGTQVQGIRLRNDQRGRVGAAATAPEVRAQEDVLPRTGMTVLPFVVIGLALVSAGALMRRRKKA